MVAGTWRLTASQTASTSPTWLEAFGSGEAEVWNGDETDWGLNVGSEALVLRVSVATY